MSYTTGTTHYNLPQTVGSDKRDWTDTNEAFSDVDAALWEAHQGATQAALDIASINSEIQTITGKQADDEADIATISGKVSTLETTVANHTTEIGDVRRDLQDNIESLREDTATSTHAYEIGDYFYYNDVLFKATAQIAIGATIVPNTNCTGVTVMDELKNGGAGSVAAEDVTFNNKASGLTATDVQDAIDEVVGMIPGGGETATVTILATDKYSDLISKITSAIDLSKVTARTVIQLGKRSYRIMNSDGVFCYIVGSATSPNFVIQEINLVSGHYEINGSATYDAVDVTADIVGTGTIYY